MSEEGKSAKDETVDRNKNNPWIDRTTITTAILIPILLLVTTQLVNTILPIMYGPSETSDFSINAEPPAGFMTIRNQTVVAEINVEDIRGRIRPYRHTVHLYSKGHKDCNFSFYPNDLKPPFKSKMTIRPAIPRTEVNREISIFGLGGDGRKRNTSYLLEIEGPLDFRPETAGIPPSNFSPNLSTWNPIGSHI
jgi:hypothetical protein